MRKILLSIIIILALSCCSTTDDDKDRELVGEWKLIEILSDPGDGSGTFKTVNSEKKLAK